MSERAAASRSEGRRCGEKIRDERHACEQVEQCKRLSDPSVSNKGFELNAHQITQVWFYCMGALFFNLQNMFEQRFGLHGLV